MDTRLERLSPLKRPDGVPGLNIDLRIYTESDAINKLKRLEIAIAAALALVKVLVVFWIVIERLDPNKPFILRTLRKTGNYVSIFSDAQIDQAFQEIDYHSERVLVVNKTADAVETNFYPDDFKGGNRQVALEPEDVRLRLQIFL